MLSKTELWIKSDHRLGESIIWHAARRQLLWVDLLDPALFMHDPKTGITARHALALPPPIGSIAATSDAQRILLAHTHGLSLLHLETLDLELYCDPEAGRDEVIYNDIKVDRWGRLWVGTSHAREQDPRGALWCVMDRKTWALGDVGFAVSNGPAFSLDGGTLIFNDSAGRRTLLYDISAGDLKPRNRRLLRSYSEAEGMPDGVVVDSAGRIWSAQWNGAALLQISAAGEVQHRVQVPAFNVTTLCFGGEELKDIYITTATDGASPEMMQRYPLTGSLFRLKADLAGCEEPLFPL